MSTKHFARPSVPYAGEAGLSNRTLLQDISATRPRIPIGSAVIDGQFNYLIDAVNELFDTAISGTVPDASVTLAKLSLLDEGSVIASDGSAMVEVVASGNAGYVLTENSSGAPSFQAPAGTPTGAVIAFAGSTAPAGYLLCYGQPVSRSTYSALFTVISTTYGAGNGTTTFNLPDLRGRTTFGQDNMGGTAASRVTTGVSGIDGTALGAVGGNENMQGHTHTATVTDPGHNHAVSTNYGYTSGGGILVNDGAGTPASTRPTNNATTGITVANSTTGTGASQNMPPAIILNYIIKT